LSAVTGDLGVRFAQTSGASGGLVPRPACLLIPPRRTLLAMRMSGNRLDYFLFIFEVNCGALGSRVDTPLPGCVS